MKDWNSIKDPMYQLYVVERLHLRKVIVKLEEDHNFKASPRAFKIKINEWGWRTNRHSKVASTALGRRRKTEQSQETPSLEIEVHAQTTPDLVILEDHIDALDSNGKAKLHFAVEDGNIETVQELLSSKASIDVSDRRGATALYIATSSFDWSNFERTFAIILLLLRSGAYANAETHSKDTPFRNFLRNTPLMLAPHIFLPLVDNFLRHGADVILRDPITGKTPLETIIERGAFTFVMTDGLAQTIVNFLEKGAHLVLVVNHRHLLCLLIEIQATDKASILPSPLQDLMLRLCKSKMKTPPCSQCDLPIYTLIRHEKSLGESFFGECLMSLLENADDQQIMSAIGRASLGFIVRNHHLEIDSPAIIRWMVANGVDPFFSEKEKVIPLHEAYQLWKVGASRWRLDLIFQALIDACIFKSYASFEPATAVSSKERTWWRRYGQLKNEIIHGATWDSLAVLDLIQTKPFPSSVQGLCEKLLGDVAEIALKDSLASWSLAYYTGGADRYSSEPFLDINNTLQDCTKRSLLIRNSWYDWYESLPDLPEDLKWKRKLCKRLYA